MAGDVLARIAADQHRSRMTVREILIEKGRPDLLAEFDRRHWEIETGVDGARSIWSALTEPQRAALVALAEGRRAFRAVWSRAVYDATGGAGVPLGGIRLGGIRLATLRALQSRKLVSATGSPSDPERRFEITRPGAFVVKRGRPPTPKEIAP